MSNLAREQTASPDLGGEGNERASRILVLSLGTGSHLALPSLHNLVQAIKGASPATTAPEDVERGEEEGVTAEADADVLAEASSFEYRAEASSVATNREARIPWHISNRYYDAHVHFVARSIPLQRPRAGRRDQRGAARSAIGSGAEGQGIEGPIDAETDQRLRDRARDVFAALEAPSRSAAASSSARPRVTSAIADAATLTAIQEAAEGVPAVVLVVDREQPFSVHRDMLVALSTSSQDASVPSLSGHDLDVSLVLGIPSPMANAAPDATGRSRSDKPSEEELAELYAQEGWEYVDLISSAEADLYDDEDEDLDGHDREDIVDVGAGAAEEHGFDRVREALETHLWPGLVRKDDRASRLAERERRQMEDLAGDRASNARPLDVAAFQSFSDFQDSTRGAQEGEEDNGEAATAAGERNDDDAEEARLTALLDAVLVQLGGANLGGASAAGTTNFEPGSAEVTPEDEALARAFMEQIARHERNQDQVPSEGTEGQNPTSRAREELEKFLDEQGGEEWLASGAGSASGTGTATGEGGEGFDDDFADFVAAPGSTGGASSAGGIGAAGGGGGLGADEGDPDFDFASALHSVRAQAERVRAIQDPEQRREEAARVALAFSNRLA